MDILKSRFNASPCKKKIALLSSFPPTQCGIATFASDLTSAIQSSNADIQVDIFAVNDRSEVPNCTNTEFSFNQKCHSSYFEAAMRINAGGYSAVSIQHEYGIFGGDAGSFLLDLVWNLEVPVITTLHTVLDEPSLAQRHVLESLVTCSERIVVMSEKAIDLLIKVHGIDPSKIDLIHHGIPVVPKMSDKKFRLGVPESAPLILTFGLLSPDKGIQHVIEAMPSIIKEFPEATYAVIGATHPHILESSGDLYRKQLEELATDLGVADHVVFVNRFVPLKELVGYLSAMDMYITPYLKKSQITSGTLAYAVGAGKPVISTPYWYAEEILAENRGILVPFRDPESIAQAVIQIQQNPETRLEMSARASEFGRNMLWEQVGASYANLIKDVSKSSPLIETTVHKNGISVHQNNNDLPEPNFNHLFELTDDTGILQHAKHSVPNREEGYCVDDNARALLLTALLEKNGSLSVELLKAQGRYLSFLLHAFNPDNGRFRNFMNYQRNWLEISGSDDSHGRSVWALGAFIHNSKDTSRRKLANDLFKQSLEAFDDITSPRTWAYGILAANDYLHVFPQDLPVRSFMKMLALRLMKQLELGSSHQWTWFEDRLTYANARLPQALMIAGAALGDQEMSVEALKALNWLRLIQLDEKGRFAPVGSSEFYIRGGEKSKFDQQPIEAASSVSAYLTAAQITKDEIWHLEAQRTFAWFTGRNSLELSLIAPNNGGCYDGLHPDRINFNQGAESTLSYLCALTELRSYQQSQTHFIREVAVAAR